MLTWKNKKLEKGHIRGQIIKNGTAYGVLLLALVAMTFFGVCTPRGQNFLPQSGTPAEVAGSDVTISEFKMAYARYENYYKAIYQEQFDPATINLSKVVLEGLVRERVAAEMAKSLGVAADEKDVKKQIIDQFKDDKGQFNQERFNEYLRYAGLSEKDIYSEFERRERLTRLQTILTETGYISPSVTELQNKVSGLKLNVEYARVATSDIKISVTPTDINAFLADAANKPKLEEKYNKNISEYKKEKRVKARHLLVSYEGARRAEGSKGVTKEAAKSKADGLLAAVRSATGKELIELIKKNTDEESGKKSGGDLGFFKAGDMAKEFSDAAFAMKEGETSGVVESPFGFHIIRVEGVEEAKEVKLEQVQNELAKALIVETKQPAVAEARAKELTDAASKKDLQELSTKLKELGIKWEETGSFSQMDYSIPKLGGDKEIVDAVLSLKQAGEVYPNTLKVRDQFYLLRLKSITQEAPKEKDDVEKAAQQTSQKLFADLSDKYKKSLEAAGKIKVNDDFLNLSAKSKEKVQQ